MKNLYLTTARKLIQMPFIIGLFVFLPAGTFNYWQGWLFNATFSLSALWVTLYMAIKDPALLERRMNVGPQAEKEPAQKLIMWLAIIFFTAFIILPGFDYRFQWSQVPFWVVILGNVFIALSFLFIFFIFKSNSYAAATVQIAKNQKVISTGPYAIVRHPMYICSFPLIVGIPLALGSWWGLLFCPLSFAGLIWRLLDEEKFLHKNLAGYTEYTKKVRYRLIPFIW